MAWVGSLGCEQVLPSDWVFNIFSVKLYFLVSLLFYFIFYSFVHMCIHCYTLNLSLKLVHSISKRQVMCLPFN
jgi:hypothetical protein